VRAEGTCAELLTQEHATILETSDLPPPVIDEIRAVLAKHDLAVKRVEHPRRSLESLFLDIVARARAEGVRTSGAAAGGPVAGFLAADSGGNDAGTPTAAAGVDAGLLDSLTRR